MKNIARTLILAALVSTFAHPLAAQFRTSVSFDYYDFAEDGEGNEPLRAHGGYVTASYDLLSAGDNTELAFALIAGFGINRFGAEGTGTSLVEGGVPALGRWDIHVTQIFGGVGAAFFVRRDIMEFHLSTIPGRARGSVSLGGCAIQYDECDSESLSAYNYAVRMDFGLAAWLQQNVGLRAGVGVDRYERETVEGDERWEFSDKIHITVGVALRF